MSNIRHVPDQLSLLEVFNSEQDDKQAVKSRIGDTNGKGITVKSHLNCCTLLITVNLHEGKLYKIFTNTEEHCYSATLMNMLFVNVYLKSWGLLWIPVI